MEGNELIPGSGNNTPTGLITSSVPRSLDNKNRLFGFELPDLLFIFMNLAVTNFVFGSSSLRYPLVWGSTVFFALFLYFMKKDKPENYLQHLGEYIVQPTVRFAGRPDLKHRPFLRKISNEHNEQKNEQESKTGNNLTLFESSGFYEKGQAGKSKPDQYEKEDKGKSENKKNGEHYERK